MQTQGTANKQSERGLQECSTMNQEELSGIPQQEKTTWMPVCDNSLFTVNPPHAQ